METSQSTSSAAIAAAIAEKVQKAALVAEDAAKIAATATCPKDKVEDDVLETPKAVGLQRTRSPARDDAQQQVKANAPWHRGRANTAPSSEGVDNSQSGETTLWSAADFPSLAGDRAGSRTRSKSARRLEATATPLRSRQRSEAAVTPRDTVTPKRSRRRSDSDSFAQPSQSQWHQRNPRNSYGSKSPAPQREHRNQERSLDRNQTSSELRCHSEPRGASDQSHSYPSNLPGKQAVEVVKARQEMMAIAHRMAESADQMRLMGCPDPEQFAEFLSDHASMMQLSKTLQMTAPPTTAAADPAALVAMNLLMAASGRNSMKKASVAAVPTMAAISENSCKLQTRAASPMVNSASRGQSPSPMMVPMLVPVGVRSTMNPVDELRPWRNQSMMRAPSVESFRTPLRPPRRASKYSVVNPRTGEKIVISTVVPFRWRQSKRLRILDPRTGEEVLPLQEDDDRDGHSSAGVMSRVSNGGSRLSIASNASSSSAAPRSRKSLAGRAVHQGGGWALEPASGGHWDWPLSRQEKKDRILMLSQLELLAEIEDMQNNAMGDFKD